MRGWLMRLLGRRYQPDVGNGDDAARARRHQYHQALLARVQAEETARKAGQVQADLDRFRRESARGGQRGSQR